MRVWSMLLACAQHPIHALGQGKFGCVRMRGELIGERHDACAAAAALAAGDRNLGCEATTRQGTWTGRNAVFAMCDGGMLRMNS